MDNEYENLIERFANDENYKGWREEHKKMFGKVFASAFKDNLEAEIHLTVALINICTGNFSEAVPKLELLSELCENDFDTAAVNYFMGFNYEMMGDVEKMDEYYGRLLSAKPDFVFVYPVHPYYRTAKMAQKESECTKAIYYYQKALSFYDMTVPKEKFRDTISQIFYDISTICLYMHEYDECEKFLDLSKKYNNAEKEDRNYVLAILHAIRGNEKECRKLINKMSAFMKENLEPTAKAVLAKMHPHYFAVLQKRDMYPIFWRNMKKNKHELEQKISEGNVEEAAKFISEKLNEAIPFMNRSLDTRIEFGDGNVTVYLKNFYVKTLEAEYEFLFSKIPSAFKSWKFISVNSFENYV